MTNVALWDRILLLLVVEEFTEGDMPKKGKEGSGGSWALMGELQGEHCYRPLCVGPDGRVMVVDGIIPSGRYCQSDRLCHYVVAESERELFRKAAAGEIRVVRQRTIGLRIWKDKALKDLEEAAVEIGRVGGQLLAVATIPAGAVGGAIAGGALAAELLGPPGLLAGFLGGAVGGAVGCVTANFVMKRHFPDE